MIIQEYTTIKWNSRNKTRYITLGYLFTKVGDEFIVSIEHLSKGSNAIVFAACEQCFDLRKIEYFDYRDLCHPCSVGNANKTAEKIKAISGPNIKKRKSTKTDEERELDRSSLEYVNWSKAVKERDNFTCQICSKRGGNLNSHHLMSFSKYPEYRTVLDNGITLCESCHRKFHKKCGYDNTKEQFRSYVTSL